VLTLNCLTVERVAGNAVDTSLAELILSHVLSERTILASASGTVSIVKGESELRDLFIYFRLLHQTKSVELVIKLAGNISCGM
jgi:hypothetical protein